MNQGQLTLARKLEAVQRKTVTVRHARPSVLRATFAIPDFRFVGAGALLITGVMDAGGVSSMSSNEFEDLWLGGSSHAKDGSSSGDIGLTRAIFAVVVALLVLVPGGKEASRQPGNNENVLRQMAEIGEVYVTALGQSYGFRLMALDDSARGGSIGSNGGRDVSLASGDADGAEIGLAGNESHLGRGIDRSW